MDPLDLYIILGLIILAGILLSVLHYRTTKLQKEIFMLQLDLELAEDDRKMFAEDAAALYAENSALKTQLANSPTLHLRAIGRKPTAMGVIICRTPQEAHAAVETLMVQRAFGQAGDEVEVELWE
jgi:hypothetical protein